MCELESNQSNNDAVRLPAAFSERQNLRGLRLPTNTSRTILVTLLGGFVRRCDGWLPIRGIVSLLEELGIDESSTRTGVSRLKKRGWLEPEKRDGRSGYRITELAEAALASGDKYIWHARKPATLSEGWCVATFSVPEQQRAKRHLLRSRLATLGFGNVGQGVWIAPARMSTDALGVIDDLELASYTNIFIGPHVGGQDLARMARESWDLPGIDAGYRAFIAQHQARFAQLVAPQRDGYSESEAFIEYLSALDNWRVLPMRDPALPRELLPSDWAGVTATRLIEDIVTTLDAAALAYVKQVASR